MSNEERNMLSTEEQNMQLMQISSSIGLGASADFLQKYGNWVARLLLPGGYNPDDLVQELASHLGDTNSKVYGFHIYTFNEIEKTEAWRQEMLDRIEAERNEDLK